MLNRTMMIIIGNGEVQETGEFIHHLTQVWLKVVTYIGHGLLENMHRPLDVSGVDRRSK